MAFITPNPDVSVVFSKLDASINQAESRTAIAAIDVRTLLIGADQRAALVADRSTGVTVR